MKSVAERFESGERRRLLVALVLGDTFFTLLTFVQIFTRVFPGTWAYMGEDGSPAEFFQYAKALAAAGLLIVAGSRIRSTSHRIWGGVLVYLMLDDALRLHEGIGGLLIGERWLPPDFPLAGYHGGQVVYAVLFGLVVVAAAAFAYRSPSPLGRQLTRFMLCALAALGFFAVVLDFLAAHVGASFVGFLLGMSEEVGEHLVLSAALWFAAVHRDAASSREQSFPDAAIAPSRDAT